MASSSNTNNSNNAANTRSYRSNGRLHTDEILKEILPHAAQLNKLTDALNSLNYESHMRTHQPIWGCIGVIYDLGLAVAKARYEMYNTVIQIALHRPEEAYRVQQRLAYLYETSPKALTRMMAAALPLTGAFRLARARGDMGPEMQAYQMAQMETLYRLFLKHRLMLRQLNERVQQQNMARQQRADDMAHEQRARDIAQELSILDSEAQQHQEYMAQQQGDHIAHQE